MAAVIPLVRTVGLQKSFGGLQAVQSVDFHLDRGEIRAIIGPNGAGKTTLLNMICGRTRPTAGRVLFEGTDITSLAAHDRVRLGLAYTFQIISIFGNLTVHENMALAVQRRLMTDLRTHAMQDRHTLDRLVGTGLSAVGLAHAGAQLAGSLAYGHQRLLEIAMALALAPQVLVLDEPTQGLAPEEIAALSALIRKISSGVTTLLVEHNMQVVLDLSTRVTVMDKGRIVAEGTPAEIQANPGVQRIYLGS